MSTVTGSAIPKPRKPNGARLSKDDVCQALNIGYHEYYRIYLDTKSRVPDDVVPNYGFWKVVPDDLKTKIAEEVRARHDCLKPCTDNWAAMHILYEVWRSRQVYNQVRTRQQESQSSRDASVGPVHVHDGGGRHSVPGGHMDVKAEGSQLSLLSEGTQYWRSEGSETGQAWRLLEPTELPNVFRLSHNCIATVREYCHPSLMENIGPGMIRRHYFCDFMGVPVNADPSTAPSWWADDAECARHLMNRPYVRLRDVVDPIHITILPPAPIPAMHSYGSPTDAMDIDDQKMEGSDY
ncbi:hypothetical protein BJ508DRAFT_309449 [Ascobolus immersus RN42]|uniref:Uncharacterized protein n=1 Tax=Ascobolus immersus RN42 TaxID=1160509 RepID=A0A3N4HWH0_ASCIM|nr:hypothetical protein BJ508DRAFT_309449 [Ascobolus immersus RN42]